MMKNEHRILKSPELSTAATSSTLVNGPRVEPEVEAKVRVFTPSSTNCNTQKVAPLIAPRPRRVMSPELIFHRVVMDHLASSKENNTSTTATCAQRKEEQDPMCTFAFLLDPSRSSFRSIVMDRPDVEPTSPPMRAANPVVHDSRFHEMEQLDLNHFELPSGAFLPCTEIFLNTNNNSNNIVHQPQAKRLLQSQY